MSAFILAAMLVLQDPAAAEQIDDSAPASDGQLADAPTTDAPTLIAQIEGRLAAYGDTVAQLAARKARERYLTELLLPVISRADLEDGARGEILGAIAGHIEEAEASNSRWALRQIDPETFTILWTENQRLGEDLLRLARRDEEALPRIVAALEPIALEGGYDGAGFADMADRLAIREDRPQPYGTGTQCVDGAVTLWPLENRDTVNAARAALGLDPIDPDASGDEACDSPAGPDN